MKTKMLAIAILLMAGSSLFAGPRVFVGVGFGGGYGYYAAAPPPAPVVAYAQPPAPGYGYSWVGGYYSPYAGHYAWHAGYWARPPYAHAYWVGPRYHGHRYYCGYWHR